MEQLSIAVLVTLAIFGVSHGQECLFDYECRPNSYRCCGTYMNWNRCVSRYYYGNWCLGRRCLTNLHCSASECCRLNAQGTEGVCEANPQGSHGQSMNCKAHGEKPCQSVYDCGPNECCRKTPTGQGKCVHYGQEREACSRVKSTGIVDTCPCELGLYCEEDIGSTTANTLVCQSHTGGCTSHRECQRRRPGTCCRSMGGSQRMCLKAVDAYGKC